MATSSSIYDLPDDIKRHVMFERGLSAADRWHLAQIGHVWDIESESLYKKLLRVQGEYRRVCSSKGVFPFEGRLMRLNLAFPSGRHWKECFRFVFDKFEYFMPIEQISFGSVGRLKEVDDLVSLFEMIRQVTERNAVFREGVKVLSHSSRSNHLNNATVKLYCEFVGLFALFPNIQSVPAVIYPSIASTSIEKRVKECSHQLQDILTQKPRIANVFLDETSSDAFMLFTEKGEGISRWPALKNVQYLIHTYDENIQRAVNEILLIPRTISLSLHTHKDLYGLDKLIMSSHVTSLSISSEVRTQELISAFVQALDRRVSGLQDISVLYDRAMLENADTLYMSLFAALERHAVRFKSLRRLVLRIPPTVLPETYCGYLQGIVQRREVRDISFVISPEYRHADAFMKPPRILGLIACLVDASKKRKGELLRVSLSGISETAIKSLLERYAESQDIDMNNYPIEFSSSLP